MNIMTAGLQRFLHLNGKVSGLIEPRLPHFKPYLLDVYTRIVADYMNSQVDGGLIIDVGGGRWCSFAQYKDPGGNARIVAVDISEEELKLNHDVDEKIVADVVHDLPFSDGEVDMVVSRSVLEHLQDTEAFIRNTRRVLKPGGYVIHLFPLKFAPYAVINRFLPQRLSQKLIHFIKPGTEGQLGFPAFYDNCSISEISSLLNKYDFEIVELRVTYYQSYYFDFFVPLYLVSVVYELAIRALGAKSLAAAVLVVARRK
jgi:ubiquinone/menaquinone biosynthesis C-methylase UbiE